jgi:glyoxylase-like metal-dependent hydrolase (beta-lactamase superfamily II)
MAYKVETFATKPFEENCYVLYDAAGEAIVIDPGEAGPALSFIQEHKLHVNYILLTHGHFDHTRGVGEIKRASGAPVAVHPGDAALIGEPLKGGAPLFGYEAEAIVPDQLLADGQVVKAGEIALRVIHAPGHTPGLVVLYDEPNRRAFCGDLIFRGSIGRTDLAGADLPTLLRSIHEKILTMPDDVVLYPGHGPTTTVGEERRSNPFIQPSKEA